MNKIFAYQELLGYELELQWVTLRVFTTKQAAVDCFNALVVRREEIRDGMRVVEFTLDDPSLPPEELWEKDPGAPIPVITKIINVIQYRE